ncbi:MAG: DNA polymerase Y family protein [Qipengyuania sp.]|jgi:protein ImuB|nr:DNA polymerase Y family protein [Qipengyuania sp.]
MPPRRILSLWLPALAMDRHRLAHGEEEPGRPRVLIANTAHGPRIAALGRPAAEAGARVGMMLADARALCPRIAAAPRDQAGDLALLEQLAVWSGRWGPWVALDPPDGLLVDVTAVAHLFGGEAELIGDVHAAFARRGLAVRAAIAPTAGAAWALAHFGSGGAILEGEYALTEAQRHGEEALAAQPLDTAEPCPGGEKAASRPNPSVPLRLCERPNFSSFYELPLQLADLPVAALRLESAVLTVLRRLGIKRIGQLSGVEDAASGRDAIQRRFRNRRSPAANPLLRLDQLLGRIPEPLLPVAPAVPPLVQRRPMEPIRHRELLDRVLANLASDMARELERRGEGARRLELGLWRIDGAVTVKRLEMAVATREAAHIGRLFAGKLDDIDAGFGIEMVRLRASWTEPLALAQVGLEAAAEKPGTTLAACIDRLTVRLGERAVSRPVPFASHLPERAQRWQKPLAPEPTSQELLAFHHRPLKLLDKPEQIAVLYATPDGYPQRFRWRGAVHDVVCVEGPERIAPEWWREKGGTRLRDYYRIEDDAGRRYWIYRAGLIGDGRGGVPDWYLQGLCA